VRPITISQKAQKTNLKPPRRHTQARKHSKKSTDFVSATETAKSVVVGQLVRLARRNRLGYDEFLYICQQARKKLELRKPKKERKLPKLLPAADLKRFFREIQNCGDVQHEIMLKLLFYTAVRVSELVGIRVADVDVDGCRIFIFETRRYGPFTARRVQQIVQQYRAKARIADHVHPHLFRHQMLTYLTSRGLSDAQIQLISGHESKKSLEVYQHLSLESVEQAYQEAVQAVGI
jgi:integrase/recombinase XerD